MAIYFSSILLVFSLIGIEFVTSQNSTDCSPCGNIRSCCPENHERCRIDKYGSEYCECLGGYAIVWSHAEDGCIAVTALWAEITFSSEYLETYGNANSADYKRLQADIASLVGASLDLSEVMNSTYAHVKYVNSIVRSLINRIDDVRTINQTNITAEVFVKFELAEFENFEPANLEMILDTELNKLETYTKAASSIITSPDQFTDVVCKDLDLCDVRYPSLNYCHENAECTSDGAHWFQCTCPEGTIDESIVPGVDDGEVCVIIECPADAQEYYCLNGGTCVADELDSWYCDCPKWWGANRCQFDIKLLVLILSAAVAVFLLILGLSCWCIIREDRKATTERAGDSWGVPNLGYDTERSS